MSAAVQPTAPSVVIPQTFRLADRIRIQQEVIREKRYTIIGRLSTVVFEGQRKLGNLSQSRPRWWNSKQSRELADQPALHPFSEAQAKLWASVTLDWLAHEKSPIIAVSVDRQDLLLPFGLTALPPIPDPRWTAKHARQACPYSKNGCKGCNPPRIPQKLVGCPVVGDRVTDMIKARDGRVYGVLHPILELCVLTGGGRGGFGVIKGSFNGADRTHLSLLLDDSNPDRLEGYFLGGQFRFGG